MDNRNDIAIQITGLKKRYRLGTIGGGTLQGDIQSWWAKVRKKEDPNLKIGQKRGNKNEIFMALNGINLTVKKGERLGIIGHNGAGKSTLLKLLSRVTAPTEGTICIDGRISSMLEVGTGFNPELTGRENIYLNGAILGMTAAEVDSKIDEIIAFSECGQFIDTPVKRYSSGMYVKLAFAVAAHLDSEILVMDEVLAVGDMKFQQKCLGKMSDVSQSEGRTVLYVSHNMSTIRQLCNRCIVLDHGTVIFDGDVESAIELYMKADDRTMSNYNLDISPRPNAHMGTVLRCIKLSFTDGKENAYGPHDKMQFRLDYVLTRPKANIAARIELHYADGTRLGLAQDFEKEHLPDGMLSRNYSYQLELLPEGKYYFIVDVYEINTMGTHSSLDHPMEKIFFEIVRETEEGINWDHRYMGHVKLGALNKYEKT